MAVNDTHDPGDDPDDPGLLPCGRSLDALLGHAREGRLTDHERTCPHCGAAVAEFRVLSAARDEAERDLPPAPPGLVDQVMRTVRAEGRSGGFVALASGGRGWTRVRESAVSALLRAACDTVPGAAVGGCRFSQEPDGVAVELTAHFTGQVPAPRLAEELREAVRAAAGRHLGWHIARVDVRFR